MDLRKYNIIKRFTQKNENDSNDEGKEEKLEFEYVDKFDYLAMAKQIYEKPTYYTKKVFYKSASMLKNLKNDICGTNLFKKYEPNTSNVKTNALFTGPGYNYFKKLMLILTLMCPTLLFVVPEIYLAFIAEYVFNAATSVKPSKRKHEKDIPLSHRQKRMIALRKEKAVNKKIKIEKKQLEAKKSQERKVIAKHHNIDENPSLNNDSRFDASLC